MISSSPVSSSNRRRRIFTWATVLCFVAPVLASMGCTALNASQEWRSARRDSSQQAPDPRSTPDAVIQIYGARTVGSKGALGVHTWIVVKPSGAMEYTRYEVVGWGVMRGRPAIQVNRSGPDNYWFGATPELIADRRGPEVDGWIRRIEAAIETYPYKDYYRTWPGPNSNTFVAHIGRSVPELRLDLPPTAIGKDYLPDGAVFARTPSGTGVQASMFGVLGILGGWEEGVELNVLGLTFGLDLNSPALKLPGVGRLGFPQR